MKFIITEKYKQGEAVKDALPFDFSKQEKYDEPYWTSELGIMVFPLQGQIWNLTNKESRNGYPDFPELEWEINSRFKQKELLLENFLDESTEVVVATDYDREGELIGVLSVLIPKFGEPNWDLLEGWKTPVTRMKYSSMDPDEIKDAWENRSDPEKGLFEMGLCRAEVDYRVGINLSKAITKALLRSLGEWESMSAGRVQTPLLDIIQERTQERREFDPDTYWSAHIEVKE